jgi:cell division cycle 2-like protein
VYQARDKTTKEIVALKRIKMSNQQHGISITLLREVQILLQMNHPNVLKVKEIVRGTILDDIFLVMEYIDFELYDFLKTTSSETPLLSSEIKCLLKQLLQGLTALHSQWIVHRDLKTQNLLLTSGGKLKIADFGSARSIGFSTIPSHLSLSSNQLTSSSFTTPRSISPMQQSSSSNILNQSRAVRLSPTITTPLYRAPEIFLGSTSYTSAVDMWAVGAIFAELSLGAPFFTGQNEVSYLFDVFLIRLYYI